jgi:transcriptional regulator with XRE-family HTH domain
MAQALVAADNAVSRISNPPGKLAARRLLAGISQDRVALHVPEISRDGLSRVETGSRWLTPRQLVGLARFYGVKPGVIAEEALEAWLSAHAKVSSPQCPEDGN